MSGELVSIKIMAFKNARSINDVTGNHHDISTGGISPFLLTIHH